jgi:hypothetical protein
MKKDSVRCQDLPIWFLHCFMQLPPHATAVAVTVVVGATAARSSPLHHSNRRLRPRHTAVCWRDPRPISLTGQLIGRWSHRTPTSLHGVAGGGHAPSMVGVAPTVLHWPKGPRYRAVRGKRRRRRAPHHGDHWPRWGMAIQRTACISVGPQGRPQGPLAPRTDSTPSSSPTSSTLAAPLPPP